MLQPELPPRKESRRAALLRSAPMRPYPLGMSVELGASYAQVSAGYYHIVLPRSDGQAVAFGNNMGPVRRSGVGALGVLRPGLGRR